MSLSRYNPCVIPQIHLKYAAAIYTTEKSALTLALEDVTISRYCCHEFLNDGSNTLSDIT